MDREVMDVSFVHGHPRAAGWVKGHLRKPTRAEEGQLPLLMPLPRSPEPEAEPGTQSCTSAPFTSAPFTSARKSAITRS
ncbi:hypothetical protein GCM10009609_67240 [Pseudonocardia aurantiaca]